MIVRVESHSRARASRVRRLAPDAGAHWGKPSRFTFDDSAEDAEMKRRGGITVVWPAERIETVNVRNFTPVWRKVEVVKVPSSENPDDTEEAGITREVLLPVGESRQKYIGAGTGYVKDTQGQPFKERIIHTFVQLHMASPIPEAEVLRVEEQGTWPDLPTELNPPGTFVHVPPIPGIWHR